MIRDGGAFTVWLTGLPASGKTTITELLERELEKRNLQVIVLDGDQVRALLPRKIGFSKKDRDEQVDRVSSLARARNDNGKIVVVALISPYRKARSLARRRIRQYIEVYVDCPLAICQKRDPKGLYAKAVRGEIGNFTGISDPYEHPLKPEIHLRTDQETPEESVKGVIEYLVEHGYIECNTCSPPA